MDNADASMMSSGVVGVILNPNILPVRSATQLTTDWLLGSDGLVELVCVVVFASASSFMRIQCCGPTVTL